MSAADDLKRLAEAYPWTASLLSEHTATCERDICKEHRQLRDLAAQLYASNRALNERIVKLRAGLDLRLDTYRRYPYDKFLGRSIVVDFEAALAADDAAQRKG